MTSHLVRSTSLAALVLTSCYAQGVPSRAQEPSADQLLRIEVTGSFDHLVLTDPKRRVNLITETGAESTFAGCSRADMPEQFGIPDTLDYARFRILGPVAGRYVLTMRATKPGGILISVSGQWNGGGTADAEGVEASAGDQVMCVVRMIPAKGSKVGAYSARVETVKAQRGRP